MKIDFEEFKIFCVTPSSPDSNKANSYVKAIQIILNYLNIDSEQFSSHDYEKVQELSKSLSNKNSANYIKLHDFVSSRKQVSYLEGGFISAAINYFKKYYASKEQNMDSKIKPKERTTHENLRTRYINSLLAKPFVILTGNSGTGKTRIATKFAEYMKQDDSLSNTLLVPVGADWTDNTKILGYYNPLANNGIGKYEKTPIFEFIERATENPTIPFFLILDEMNLSHVERYFSDFLSKMELVDYHNPEKRTYFDISGYGLLEFPKNLFITGTVNIDETTYMFSPKVLDRANVIEFKPKKDKILDTLLSDNATNETESSEPDAAEKFMKLANEVRSRNIPDDISKLLNEMYNIFDAFYTELEKFGFEFAYRTIKEIRQYTVAACITAEDEEPSANQIADIQILQKILPKIHGNRKQIGDLLENLEKLTIEKNLGNSLQKIKQMKDRLNRFQYASFI